jgi:replication initiator protein RepSA
VVAVTWFATAAHPAKPKGWDICWGPQLDIRTVRMSGAREITDTAVASYLAKYATKSTEAVGPVAARITPGNLHADASPFTHHGRLIRAAWTLGHHPHQDFQALRRWAHMLGFRGHFATKSRRYSTTLRALWAAPDHLAPPPVRHRRAQRGNHPDRRHPHLCRHRLAHHRR